MRIIPPPRVPLTRRRRCLATPCHTQDSICYHVTGPGAPHPGGVFTGDTLFIAGCGRFFEGTAPEMHAALSYLGSLPDKTVVYNGHEYTAGNVKFAKSVDPDNEALKRLQGIVQTLAVTTGETTIGEEKEWNPFMRLDSAPILCVFQCSVLGGGRTTRGTQLTCVCLLCITQEGDGRRGAERGHGRAAHAQEQLQGVSIARPVRPIC